MKWITERLENPEDLEKYKDLKQRIHENHGFNDVTESCMLRFLHGMEYDVDVAEEKIVYHVNFMQEHDYWQIDESSVPNIKPENIL